MKEKVAGYEFFLIGRIRCDSELGNRFSSGEGELLGVVIWPSERLTVNKDEQNEQRDRLKPYITQWGMNPIWQSSPTTLLPQINNFVRRIASGYNVTLPELSEGGVNIAGHSVEYDDKRELLYCDTEIDDADGMNSYYPFIRLARYQPHSIKDISSISQVVLADFCQIAPDRSLLITFDPYNPHTLSGRTYSRIDSAVAQIDRPVPEKAGSYIQIGVEQRDPAIDSDLGWKEATNILIIPNKISSSGNVLWRGTIKLLDKRNRGQIRLVVKEFESLYEDSKGFRRSRKSYPGRLVYAEILEF